MRGICYILINLTIIRTLTLADINNNLISIYKHGLRKFIPQNGKEDKFAKNFKTGKNTVAVLNGLRNSDKLDKTDLDLEKQKHHRKFMNSKKKQQHYDGRRRRKKDSDTSTDTSSSLELKHWKDEWKELWLQKKLEAINTSVPKGDMVNMVAARPWGVPCGDPNQHDAPWGSCMLPMECDPEFRIYRGDYFCGRTTFICCALQLTNYDLYGGFDVSFADSSLATDSEEKKNRDRGSKERKRRRKTRDRKRRLRARKKRKRKIKRTIRKIVREIKKILNRSFRNGTTARKKKTQQLKKFIKDMKRKYIKERKSVQDIHEIEMIKIDAALQKRLNEISSVNQQYMRNSTFRENILNGSISRGDAKMLVNAYPDLADLFNTGRRKGTEPKDLEYDIEYGYLYY